MELTLKSMLDWTTLTVRDPRLASTLVKEAKLPLEVSVIMIVLAGVVSGITFGIFTYAIELALADVDYAGEQFTMASQSPILQGVLSAVQGLAFAFAVHRIGAALGGRGEFGDLMSVTAIVQIVAAVIFMAVVLLFFVVPLLGAGLAVFSVIVFLRGLGHAVDVGHDFSNMGKSAAVIILAFVAVFVVVTLLASVLGLGTNPANSGVSL